VTGAGRAPLSAAPGSCHFSAVAPAGIRHAQLLAPLHPRPFRGARRRRRRFDQPGGDYTNFEAASWFVCRNSCGGDSRCRAWTWVKPDIQGPAGRCWLKDRTPPLVRNACCNSGSGANIRKADLKAEDKTDRPGFDINNFTVRGWQECERACAGESQCGGWSYARAGVQGPQGRCWIKSRAPNPVVNPGIVSGVKWKPRSVRID
jgi:PAN domain